MRFLEVGESLLSPNDRCIAPLVLGGIIAAGASLAGNMIGSSAQNKARCQQGRRQKAGDQFFHIENSFTSFFFPAPGPTLFLP